MTTLFRSSFISDISSCCRSILCCILIGEGKGACLKQNHYGTRSYYKVQHTRAIASYKAPSELSLREGSDLVLSGAGRSLDFCEPLRFNLWWCVLKGDGKDKDCDLQYGGGLLVGLDFSSGDLCTAGDFWAKVLWR